jgi:hypothetical protein
MGCWSNGVLEYRGSNPSLQDSNPYEAIECIEVCSLKLDPRKMMDIDLGLG